MMIKEEQEPEDTDQTCGRALSSCYHSKAYLVFCICQICFLFF